MKVPTVEDLLNEYERELEELDGEDPPIAMIRACDKLLEEMDS